MPVFSYDEVLSPGSSVFQGKVEQSLAWESAIYSPALDGIASWDSAITNAIGSARERVLGTWPDGTVITETVSFAARQGMFNMVNVSRQVMGQAAMTVGYLNRAVPLLRKINHPSAERVANALNTVGGVLETVSDQFVALYQQAMDAIGFLPVVGWVIKTVVRLGEFISGILQSIRAKRTEEAREFLARQAGIPISATEFSSVADTVQGRLLFDHLGPLNDAQWIVMPRYGARPVSAFGGFEDWQAQWKGIKQWAGDGDSYDSRQLAWAWLLRTDQTDGLGFVPGTRNIHGALWFPTRFCGTVRDLGDLFPSARVGAYNWWNQLLQQTPMMMSVDTRQVERAWLEYMEAAFQFALLESSKGWTCAEATEPFSTKFLCLPETKGMGGCKQTRTNTKGEPVIPNSGKWLDIPGDGHMSAHLAYLSQLFFGDVLPPRIQQNRPALSADGDTSNVDWDKAIPLVALRDLRERQFAALQSYDCPYVDSTSRYRAIHQDAELRGVWESSVRAIFEANEWRGIRFADVPPESEVRAALLERCAAANIDCATLGPSAHTRMGAPVLSPPVLDPPPAPVEVDTTPRLGHLIAATGGRRRRGGAGVALGVLLVAGLLARKK